VTGAIAIAGKSLVAVGKTEDVAREVAERSGFWTKIKPKWPIH
jgi:hypothetical protein